MVPLFPWLAAYFTFMIIRLDLRVMCVNSVIGRARVRGRASVLHLWLHVVLHPLACQLFSRVRLGLTLTMGSYSLLCITTCGLSVAANCNFSVASFLWVVEAHCQGLPRVPVVGYRWCVPVAYHGCPWVAVARCRFLCIVEPCIGMPSP